MIDTLKLSLKLPIKWFLSKLGILAGVEFWVDQSLVSRSSNFPQSTSTPATTATTSTSTWAPPALEPPFPELAFGRSRLSKGLQSTIEILNSCGRQCSPLLWSSLTTCRVFIGRPASVIFPAEFKVSLKNKFIYLTKAYPKLVRINCLVFRVYNSSNSWGIGKWNIFNGLPGTLELP